MGLELGVKVNAELGVRANAELRVRAKERTNERASERFCSGARSLHTLIDGYKSNTATCYTFD